VLRVYQIQREEFLPSAHATIFSFTGLVVVLLFFFVYLLLLDVISKPFKVGWPPSPRRWRQESPSLRPAPAPLQRDRTS